MDLPSNFLFLLRNRIMLPRRRSSKMTRSLYVTWSYFVEGSGELGEVTFSGKESFMLGNEKEWKEHKKRGAGGKWFSKMRSIKFMAGVEIEDPQLSFDAMKQDNLCLT
jgi:hypothetical protein